MYSAESPAAWTSNVGLKTLDIGIVAFCTLFNELYNLSIKRRTNIGLTQSKEKTKRLN